MPRDGTKVEAEVAAVPVHAPVLVIGFGRGANGKSTGLAEMAWRAEAAGRPVLVADGDHHRSKTLSDLFPEASTHPASTEPNEVKRWLNDVLNRMVRERTSVVLDLGTENRVLQEYCRDLRLVEFCARRGFGALAAYFLGPEPEDLRHVLAVWEGGYFRPKNALLVMNEGVVRGARTVAGAFDGTLADSRLGEMLAAGVRPVFMSRLACIETARAAGLGFYRAADKLDPVEGFMCEDWTAALEAEREKVGASAWLP